MDVFFLMSFSDCTGEKKYHLKKTVFAKTVFKVHVAVGKIDFH